MIRVRSSGFTINTVIKKSSNKTQLQLDGFLSVAHSSLFLLGLSFRLLLFITVIWILTILKDSFALADGRSLIRDCRTQNAYHTNGFQNTSQADKHHALNLSVSLPCECNRTTVGVKVFTGKSGTVACYITPF